MYHSELVTNPDNVKGGGWWRFSKNKFTFWADSQDYGMAKFEDVRKCILDGKVYSNKSKSFSIAHKYKWAYDIGSEKIDIIREGDDVKPEVNEKDWEEFK